MLDQMILVFALMIIAMQRKLLLTPRNNCLLYTTFVPVLNVWGIQSIN